MASLNILGIGDEEPGNLLSLSPPLSDGTPRGVQQIPERDALAALYNNVTSMIDRPAVPGLLRPSWNPNNPVGTERVREQYLTNPDLDVVPGVKWGESWVSPQNAAGLNRAQAIGEGFAGSASPGKGLLGIKAYHGSPHSFERFDTSRIGTGEGAQAYGHGLYFAEREGVAKGYRDTLSGGTLTYDGAPLGTPGGVSLDGSIKARINQGMTPQEALKDTLGTMRHMGKGSFVDEAERAWSNPDLLRYEKNPGSMYEVNIAANPEHMLHWDKPLSEQSPYVQKALAKVHAEDPEAWQRMVTSNPKGSELYESGGIRQSTQAQALREAGIPGIRYLDQGSRGAGEGSHNLVVFDDATIEILRKYGLAGLMLGGGGAAAARGNGE